MALDDSTCCSTNDPLVTRFLGLMDNHTKMWRINGLMLLDAILMLLVVGVAAYAPRYRRHPVIGFLFMGATILLLPIVSDVASTVGAQVVIDTFSSTPQFLARCMWGFHIVRVLVWTGLVLVIGIDASIIVAGDAREGTNMNPPTQLLITAVWLAYLALSTPGVTNLYDNEDDDSVGLYHVDPVIVLVQQFVIIFIKLLIKYSAFYKARRSFALGRSPRLIAGYMSQLQQHATDPESHKVTPTSGEGPPALVVLGEETVEVIKQLPHGYNLNTKGMPDYDQSSGGGSGTKSKISKLVTLDRVWQLDDMLLGSQPKDLCLSFALFKLLRCRFAKYKVSEGGFLSAHKFVRETLLQGDDYVRLFRVIGDELSFVHDYYYSSLPISYSHYLFPILSIVLSLGSICYCLFIVVVISREQALRQWDIDCQVWCIGCQSTNRSKDGLGTFSFGRVVTYVDAIPIYLALAVTVLAETRHIFSFICSNWTKVSLIYHYINTAAPWQRSSAAQKRIGFVFKNCRCKLVNNWADKMNQCSMLAGCQPWSVSLPLRRLLHLPNQKKIKVPSAVKEAVFKALKGLTGEHIIVRPPSPPISNSTIGDMQFSSLPGSDGKHTAYTILVWHIATSIVEVSHSSQPSADDLQHHNKIAARHLSRYCVYLVAFCPELLPGDDELCKKLYKDVKKDADRILNNAEPRAGYQKLLQLLSVDSNNYHEVLKNGARLGEQMVDSGTGWEALARFWSEMITYVAPSENLEGHAEAIARGGELVTLVWALLGHAGIVGRLDVASEGLLVLLLVRIRICTTVRQQSSI